MLHLLKHLLSKHRIRHIHRALVFSMRCSWKNRRAWRGTNRAFHSWYRRHTRILQTLSIFLSSTTNTRIHGSRRTRRDPLTALTARTEAASFTLRVGISHRLPQRSSQRSSHNIVRVVRVHLLLRLHPRVILVLVVVDVRQVYCTAKSSPLRVRTRRYPTSRLLSLSRWRRSRSSKDIVIVIRIAPLMIISHRAESTTTIKLDDVRRRHICVFWARLVSSCLHPRGVLHSMSRWIVEETRVRSHLLCQASQLLDFLLQVINGPQLLVHLIERTLHVSSNLLLRPHSHRISGMYFTVHS